MRAPRIMFFLAFTWTFAFWISCIAIPVVQVLVGFAQSEKLGATESLWHALIDPLILDVVNVTLCQALLSSIISVLLGTTLGLWLKGPSRSWDQALLLLPFAIPTVVAAQTWILWLGRSGELAQQWGIHSDWIYSLKAVVLAHVFFNAPLVAWMVSHARQEVPARQLEAAQILGASRIQQLTSVVWPYVRWSVASSWAQVMALCMMSFGLVLILGGGPPVQTLEVEIYQRLRMGRLDLPGAVICGIWELAITLIPWALVLFFNGKRQKYLASGMSVESAKADVERPRRLGVSSRWVIHFFQKLFRPSFFGLLGFLVFILPYGIIFEKTAVLNFFHLSWWLEVAEPLKSSLLLAAWTSGITVLTTVAALITLHRFKFHSKTQAWLTFLLGLPSGISILVLGLGVWMFYGQWMDPFEGGLFAIVALQVALVFPVALRLLLPLLSGIRSRELEAAVLLGAGPVRAFWNVEGDRWRGPLLHVFAVSAASSLGELGAVSLFYNEKLLPLPLLISRWMQQYRFDEAQGVSGLLLIGVVLLTVGLRPAAWRTEPPT